MQLNFHYDIEGFRLRDSRKVKRVINKLIIDCGRKPGKVEAIFTSDEKVLEINREFLSHDYLTDIITFDYCEGKVVNGEIYISADRIKENAKANHVTLMNEAARVIIHGFLHLCGYGDGSQKEKAVMTEREDVYLALVEAE